MRNELKKVMKRNMVKVNEYLASDSYRYNSERIAFLNSVLRDCWTTANDFITKGMDIKEAEEIYTPYRKVIENLIQYQ